MESEKRQDVEKGQEVGGGDAVNPGNATRGLQTWSFLAYFCFGLLLTRYSIASVWREAPSLRRPQGQAQDYQLCSRRHIL